MKLRTFNHKFIEARTNRERNNTTNLKRYTMKPVMNRMNSHNDLSKKINNRDNIFGFLQNRKSINVKKGKFKFNQEGDTISEKSDSSNACTSNVTDCSQKLNYNQEEYFLSSKADIGMYYRHLNKNLTQLEIDRRKRKKIDLDKETREKNDKILKKVLQEFQYEEKAGKIGLANQWRREKLGRRQGTQKFEKESSRYEKGRSETAETERGRELMNVCNSVRRKGVLDRKQSRKDQQSCASPPMHEKRISKRIRFVELLSRNDTKTSSKIFRSFKVKRKNYHKKISLRRSSRQLREQVKFQMKENALKNKDMTKHIPLDSKISRAALTFQRYHKVVKFHTQRSLVDVS
ncbi:unnamed protein product [Moneuplotes crassus]|uniref:Uncharacterized protein n=1 Tax=Euplotes crassus TaxID=5936 RepID=A0AAD1UFF8_EUPCR|nr:unnamed protein product [Moneuplotes crassus]